MHADVCNSLFLTNQELGDKASAKLPQKEEQVDEIDINLNDPEVEMAAIKIQAGFKGMKTRQELKSRNPPIKVL